MLLREKVSEGHSLLYGLKLGTFLYKDINGTLCFCAVRCDAIL